MTKSYNRKAWANSLQKAGLALLLAGGIAGAAQAQALNYAPSGASNVAGTYTDLATVATSTAIVTANTDDANSAAQAIGFTFGFNGVAFTQFVLNTNGLIRLGSAGPSSAAAFPPFAQTPESGPISGANAADINLIAPFNLDLGPGTGSTGYRVATTGAAPNRVCTIQWTNVADKPQAANANNPTIITTQVANFSFQVKLYETTNNVEFVYGTATAGTGVENAKFAAVGIKGSEPTASVLATKGSRDEWAVATFISGPYLVQTATSGGAHNVRQTKMPDAGRTYRFLPLPDNDATVSAIYTLGKIASPAALPHTVRAVVTNNGVLTQTNLDVTLKVTGANTFTDTKRVASLVAGASEVVTFASYPATLTVGTNKMTVTIPTDGDNTNNSATYDQLVTTNRVSYIDPGAPLDGGVGQGNFTFVAKYTLAAATYISDIVLNFAPAAPPTTTNKAPYQVVIYDASGTRGLPGKVLYTSSIQNRTTAGGTATLQLPTIAVPSSFFIGVKETSAENVALGYQIEDPVRSGTFYYSADGASWNDLAPLNAFRLAIEFGTITPSCAPPTALAVSAVTATSATVAFTAPTSGVAGYQALYGPPGFDPLTGGTLFANTASPIVLSGLSPATNYEVYVRSNCTVGGTNVYASPVTFTTQCGATQTVTAFPYRQNFDVVVPGQTLPCGLSVLNANADNATWAISATNPNSGTNSMRYKGLALNNVAADDWFFTPALSLLATSRYQVAFRYRGEGITNSPSSFTESLEVKSGTAATVAAQTNLLYTNTGITNTSYALANGASVPVVALLPAGASTQYVGFHIKSLANQGNLYVDDLTVTATVVSATSEALLRAVSLFPNPSTTGLFDLEIHRANATGTLDVQVTNTLGQRVYAGTARDNYTNRLDLSSLAPGIYFLQVRNGNERMTSQVSIVK